MKIWLKIQIIDLLKSSQTSIITMNKPILKTFHKLFKLLKSTQRESLLMTAQTFYNLKLFSNILETKMSYRTLLIQIDLAVAKGF